MTATEGPPDLFEQAERWLAQDPDGETAAELRGVLDAARSGDAAAAADLADRFAGTLQFGTAGLRGALGAGPNRMNRVVVIRAAAGLAAYLRQRAGSDANLAVVIGFDARRNSDVFAADTAAVMTGAGITAMVLPGPMPTPVLAFAVRHLGCDAGVMVTASHNPPQDNGYKVYLGGPGEEGAQIVPPADAQIAYCIAAVGDLATVPRPDDGWTTLADDVREWYLDRVARLASSGGPRDLSIVLTPLHGVGGATVVEALRRAGFEDTYTVPEQADPDAAFPTVAFPNPEEAGAIDLALEAARARSADLVIANDPDADRCAVAVPAPGADGGWRMLTGDEVGWLLGEYLVGHGLPDDAVLANSIVSSRVLGKIAAASGLGHAETLTGFKWISRVPGLAFGYEEALGYCVDPDGVRDKDGISAAVVVAQLAAELKTAGRTMLDALDELARRYGVHATGQVSVRVRDLALISGAMARLREAPPASLAGSGVVAADDLSAGSEELPATDALRYLTEVGDRVVVRPSGTEPKLKCYLEVVVPLVDDDLAAAKAQAAGRLDRLRAEVVEMLAL